MPPFLLATSVLAGDLLWPPLPLCLRLGPLWNSLTCLRVEALASSSIRAALSWAYQDLGDRFV